jgi:hypothetical protein
MWAKTHMVGVLGQCIIIVFGCHIHQFWPGQLNNAGQHGKFIRLRVLKCNLRFILLTWVSKTFWYP